MLLPFERSERLAFHLAIKPVSKNDQACEGYNHMFRYVCLRNLLAPCSHYLRHYSNH
jgi:hypothetical protein